MKIELRNFKCYDHYIVDFPTGTISLLKGPSGVGKSSILQAITWCLYGSLRGVDNRLNAKVKMSVCITFDDNFIIYRQKRPGFLKVTNNNVDYEDDVGQALINEKFQTSNLWSSISYISQGERNALLSSSNTVRMETLNDIAFNQENPCVYIEKIQEEVKKRTNNYTVKSQIYDSECDKYNQEKKEKKITTKKCLNDDEIESLNNEIATKEDGLNKLHQKIVVNEKLKAGYAQIEQSLKDKQEQFKKLDSKLLETDIDKLETNIYQFNELLQNKIRSTKEIELRTKKKQELELKKKELANIKKQLDLLPTDIKEQLDIYESEFTGDKSVINIKTLQRLQNEKANFELNKAKAAKLNIVYDEIIIDAEKHKIDTILNAQNSLKLIKEIDQLTIDYNNYELKDFDKEKLALLKSELAAAKQNRDIVECPQCETGLRNANGKLVLASNKPVSLAEINAIEKEILSNETNKKYNDKKDILKQQLSSLQALLPKDIPKDVKYLNASEIVVIKQRLTDLNKIVILDEGTYDLNLIDDILTWRDQLKEYNIIFNKFNEASLNFNTLQSLFSETDTSVIQDTDTIQENEKDLTRKITEHKNLITRFNNEISKENYLNNDIASLEKKLATLQRPEIINDSPSEILKEIKMLKEKIDIGKLANKMAIEYNNITKLGQETEEEHKRVFYTNKLQEIAKTIESQVLQDIVDNINQDLSDIVSKLFDEPITVILSLYKELKTKKQIKAVVNLQITYKGSEFNNINELSGGEGDRISLAVTLALNKISGSTLLLLDESLGSFDGELKEKAIECIRDHTGGKTVVCIAHEGVDGYYDQVIAL